MTGHWLGRRKWGPPSFSGEVHGTHTFCTVVGDTFFGPVVKDRAYQVPDQRNV